MHKYTLNLERANLPAPVANAMAQSGQTKANKMIGLLKFCHQTWSPKNLKVFLVPLCGDLRGQQKTAPDARIKKIEKPAL